MNDTEKLIVACFENFGYYITTDGQFKIEGKMTPLKQPPKKKTKKKSKRWG